MYKIYVIKESVHDATSYYIQIIEDAIKLSGNDVQRVSDLSTVKPEDIVVTVGNKMFYAASKRKPYKQINWFQGVSPEEVKYSNFHLLKKMFLVIAQTFLERYALKHSELSLMVSNTMVKHYQTKYGFNSAYFVMPCFNVPLNISSFFDKYNKPTFVYAGNMSGWQCFEETVILFKKIKEKVASAELSVFTQDQQVAHNILLKHKVDARITYLPYQQLSEEIKKFKYGFLIREDDVVNNVATPTKMNTYLANGIIPIYSTVIGSFRENLSELHYAVPLDDLNNGLNKILELENKKIDPQDVLSDYKKVFQKYYSRDYYISSLSNILKTI